MRSLHLQPFEYAVKQTNIYAVMPSYNEVDGVPAHRNKWMLDHVLRKEWGFKGYVFSDYGGLSLLSDYHKVARDRREAAQMALDAGVDLEAPRTDIYYHLMSLYDDKLIHMSQIDTAVRRILRAKFKAGLFEKQLPDTLAVADKLRTVAHINLAKKIADESIILLKNQDNLLPLNKDQVKSIAVIGPNANQVQYGDYSYTRDNSSGVTVLDGIKKLGIPVYYEKGCSVTGSDTSGFLSAIMAVKKSDVAVVVLGESSAVLSGLGWGVGLGDNEPKDPFTGGEGYDVTDLNPMGVQRELLQAIYRTGKPVILVTIHGRPWSITWEADHIPAILEAWYPGEQGGMSIADIIFGKVNPSGRLTVSVPRSVGHIPVTYDYKPGSRGYYKSSGTAEKPGRDYVFSSPEPLFCFGHGLSYTSFAYSNLRLDKTEFSPGEFVDITVDIQNVGACEGKDVVQLYIKDKISSTTSPFMALKAFSKISLKPSEKKTVTFRLSEEDFSIWNTEMKRILEVGEFQVMVGKASNAIQLEQTISFK
ncbi:MAG: glycoside hydrolase family 3 C-terminal domain-containing protein [Sphingobacterium sp.]|jgi:beta-glucosidase|nr:glycoside hydrolase family 3 C-terminal domain-containing protein [Sphingobacterium sp.]